MDRFYLIVLFVAFSSCKANSQNTYEEKLIAYQYTIIDSLENKKYYNNNQDWEYYWKTTIIVKLFNKKINLIDSCLNLAQEAPDLKTIQQTFIKNNLGEKIYQELSLLQQHLISEYPLIADSLIENSSSKEDFVQNTFFTSKEKTTEVFSIKKNLMLRLEKQIVEKIKNNYPLRNNISLDTVGTYQMFIQKMDELNIQKSTREKQILSLKTNIKKHSKLKKIANIVQKTDTVLHFFQSVSNTLNHFKGHKQESKLIADFMIGEYFTLRGKGYKIESAYRYYVDEFNIENVFLAGKNKNLDFVKSNFLATNFYGAQLVLMRLQSDIISYEKIALKKL